MLRVSFYLQSQELFPRNSSCPTRFCATYACPCLEGPVQFLSHPRIEIIHSCLKMIVASHFFRDSVPRDTGDFIPQPRVELIASRLQPHPMLPVFHVPVGLQTGELALYSRLLIFSSSLHGLVALQAPNDTRWRIATRTSPATEQGTGSGCIHCEAALSLPHKVSQTNSSKHFFGKRPSPVASNIRAATSPSQANWPNYWKRRHPQTSRRHPASRHSRASPLRQCLP